MPTTRKRGFTIVELLVVCAVLTLFAAVWISVASNGGNREGVRAPCQSNERQITLGFQQYIQDYNEFPPVGPNRTSGAMGNNGGWADSLQSYLKTVQIFQCPLEPNGFDSADPGQTDYGYKATLAGVSEASLDNSSNTFLIFEGDQTDGTAQTASAANLRAVYTTRHLGGSNYAFVDGHVKWIGSAESRHFSEPANGKNFTFAS